MAKKSKKPQTPYRELPMERRLAITRYSADECKDAIHGQQVTSTLGQLVHRLAVIRGIRYHHGFAQELRGVASEFTRALNARDIMSGVIPTTTQPDETPYCIWHPEVPSEETLRSLVQRYPDMLYQAARACAVAGYVDLYKELDPLPEVHVAEEAGYASAQGSNQGSQEIYEHILSHPVKFAIMNDYERTVDLAGRRVAPLNGDTAVCSTLAARFEYCDPESSASREKPWGESTGTYFNITEDFGIDDHDCEAPKTPDDALPLVYSPLPANLPLINKDNLIYVAAYLGDIDRYSRLRRPRMMRYETAIVVRGIFHNAFFAKWWDKQVPEQPGGRTDAGYIRRAINARRVMSNDLSWVTPSYPDELLPEQIWYPAVADPITYERLAQIKPIMYAVCLRACIVADARWMWDRMLLAPPANVGLFQPPRTADEPEDPKQWRISRAVGYGIWREATASRDQDFVREISAAMPDQLERLKHPPGNGDHWSFWYTADTLYRPKGRPVLSIDEPIIAGGGLEGPYDGVSAHLDDVDMAVFVLDAVGRDSWEKEAQRRGSPRFRMQEIYDFLGASGVFED